MSRQHHRPTLPGAGLFDAVEGGPDPAVLREAAEQCATALVRGTLGTSTQEPVLDANQFYKNSAANHYSRIIHANMADGKAYGFAYDDVGGFESLVHDGDPQRAGIILSPFGAGGNPPVTTPPTISAFFIRRSSRLMPGFRARPAVMTTMSDPAVGS